MASYVEEGWRSVAGGYDNGDYRIRRQADRPPWRWQLHVGRDHEPDSHHRSLRGARARARDVERLRIRSIKARTHVLVGIVAGLGALVTAQWITTIATYTGFVVLVVTSLHCFGYAAEVRLGDAWDWAWLRRRPPRLTRLDLAVTRALENVHRAADRRNGPQPPSLVRVLPPGPPS